jgi:hypothetical protein
MFDTAEVHIIMISDSVDHYSFMFDRGVVHIVVAGNIVVLNSLRFD